MLGVQGQMQATFIKLQGGGGSGGGCSAGWVGRRLWTAPPLIVARGSWAGLLQHFLPLFTDPLSGCFFVECQVQKFFSLYVCIPKMLSIEWRIQKWLPNRGSDFLLDIMCRV